MKPITHFVKIQFGHHVEVVYGLGRHFEPHTLADRNRLDIEDGSDYALHIPTFETAMTIASCAKEYYAKVGVEVKRIWVDVATEDDIIEEVVFYEEK